ncbi:MAG: hypothetical protein KJ017_00985 [Alphaproteobacteria bacterium]|nr:hypothetical protein [Alphaproteobacteria bacterium]
MKTLMLAFLLVFLSVPVMAAENGHDHGDTWLKPVEAKMVCMMNNKVFDKEQMSIEIEGKTYYGCCPMCKEMLGKDPAKRVAIDPVSGKEVDKATAVIGADTHGMTYYFENEENLHKFASGPMPEMKDEKMEGMNNDATATDDHGHHGHE